MLLILLKLMLLFPTKTIYLMVSVVILNPIDYIKVNVIYSLKLILITSPCIGCLGRGIKEGRPRGG
jgi:hypothetical protein